jgi:hypothetical protein
MADQIIRIKIPAQVVAVPKTVNAKVRGGEIVMVSLEPGNDGVVTIENQDDGVVITFKKKPFEIEIVTPPNTRT